MVKNLVYCITYQMLKIPTSQLKLQPSPGESGKNLQREQTCLLFIPLCIRLKMVSLLDSIEFVWAVAITVKVFKSLGYSLSCHSVYMYMHKVIYKARHCLCIMLLYTKDHDHAPALQDSVKLMPKKFSLIYIKCRLACNQWPKFAVWVTRTTKHNQIGMFTSKL